MRRHRFGLPAALVAAGYLTAVVVAAITALVTGDGDLLRLLVSPGMESPPDPAWWHVALLVLAGGAQGWALWHILRGRPAGEPVDAGTHARRLRVALYVNLAVVLLLLFVSDPPRWLLIADGACRLALVVLFHRVLDGGVERLAALVAGVLATVGSIGETVSGEYAFELVQLGGLTWALWLMLTLAAQSGDGRWRSGTVWCGVASLVSPLVVVAVTFSLTYGSDFPLAAIQALAAVFTPVWLARSAHDLVGPPVEIVRRPRGPVPDRAPSGRWPLPVVAVVLPLLPVAVNLAGGTPFWIGQRGVVEAAVREYLGALTPVWILSDFLVGIGGLALLVLTAVRHRTRRAALRAVCVLLLAAAAVGVVSAATVRDGYYAFESSGFTYADGWSYLYDMFSFSPVGFSDGGGVAAGISPLWHAAAFVASAIVLMFLYGRGPGRPSPQGSAMKSPVAP